MKTMKLLLILLVSSNVFAEDSPNPSVPAPEALASEAPASEAPAPEAPAPEAPASEAPASEAPASEAPAPEAPAPEAPAPEAPAVTISDELVEDKYKNGGYNADTCEWVDDLPRKIVAGPGREECNSADGEKVNVHICIGYVVCQQHDNDMKFIRMSTCSPSNCGVEKATDCTKQKNYYSVKGKDEQHETISGEVRKAVLENIENKK